MNINKPQKIEGLEYPEFVELVKSLLDKLGYEKIEPFSSEILMAKIKSPLSTDNHYFLLIDLKASGADVNVDLLIEKFRPLMKEKTSSIYLVSRHYVSEGLKSKIATNSLNIKINYITREDLINLIDKHNEGYWRHGDTSLLDYEKQFCDELFKDSELKKLPIFNDKYDKVLNIFIEPRIYLLYQETDTNTPLKKRVSLEQIIDSTKPSLIAGDAGTGKSTIIKRLGEQIIFKNVGNKIKSLPVYLTVVEIFEAEYKIGKLLETKLLSHFRELNDEFFAMYKLIILLDSIDELEQVNQKIIVDQLKALYAEKGIRFIIGTRNDDKLQINTGLAEFDAYRVERFNQDQIKRFIFKFFPTHEGKAEKLIEALRDNRILEKLPLTPLTLSLISILFEENDLEIPATITDIFDNFNSLLIGKATVSSRVEFIDVSFKERILSLYAYHLLGRAEHTPLTKEEFINFFKDYFDQKTIPLRKGSLEDALDYLINNTGILVLKNNKYVKFSHDSFMEYYSALEIFKHRRDKEQELVEHFFENNWQNSAVFYAGKSKDMPIFLESIFQKLDTANKLNDLLSAVMGAGYLLQALYQTDNQLRKKVVLRSIDLNIKIHEIYSKIFSEEIIKVKNFKMPILWMMNIIYFYESFNSVTLKEALKLACLELANEYQTDKKTLIGFKALTVAITLDSKRINEHTELENLVFKSNLTNDPILCLMADFSIEILKGANYDQLKKELKKEIRRLSEPVKSVTTLTISKLRFSQLDSIRLSKKVKLITEGKSDTEILEHAFMVLTDGQLPYWEIFPVGKEEGGGANKLRMALSNAISFHDAEDDSIVGIFDNDSAGIQNFQGLKFDHMANKTLKKYNDRNIYALCIPIPGDLQHYLQTDQALNFFEIEHYFDEGFLKEHDMLEITPIPKVFKVREKKKSGFVKEVKKLRDPRAFKNFIQLFETIDSLNEIDIHYNA